MAEEKEKEKETGLSPPAPHLSRCPATVSPGEVSR